MNASISPLSFFSSDMGVGGGVSVVFSIGLAAREFRRLGVVPIKMAPSGLASPICSFPRFTRLF